MLYSIDDAVRLFDANLNNVNNLLNKHSWDNDSKFALIEKQNLYLGLGIVANTIKNMEIMLCQIRQKIN